VLYGTGNGAIDEIDCRDGKQFCDHRKETPWAIYWGSE
jgi:hypothetical protein